jgi:hypothetical protein
MGGDGGGSGVGEPGEVSVRAKFFKAAKLKQGSESTRMTEQVRAGFPLAAQVARVRREVAGTHRWTSLKPPSGIHPA